MKELNVIIYGPMCATCNLLYKRVTEVLEDLQIPYELEKVEDPDLILANGYLITPVLVVNQHVLSQGEIPFFDTLKNDILSIIQNDQKTNE